MRPDGTAPLWRGDWELRRHYTFRKCRTTGKTIWPFQAAYCQYTFWGLANDDVNKPEVEKTWLTPAAYTFRKLKHDTHTAKH